MLVTRNMTAAIDFHSRKKIWKSMATINHHVWLPIPFTKERFGQL